MDENKNIGRPTKYIDSYDEQARKLCLLGATDKDLADFFEVSESTINLWKLEHPTFSESIRAGKIVADIEVASRLYDTTGDRKVVELKPFKLRNVSWNDKGKRIEIETVEYHPEERVIPADYRSQSLWLRNRRPDLWKDKQEVDHTTQGEKMNIINLGQGIKPKED